MLQAIAIFSSYAIVSTTKPQMKVSDLHKEINKCFAGVRGVYASQVIQMMDGDGEYFSNLWENQTVSGAEVQKTLKLDFSPHRVIYALHFPKESLLNTTLKGSFRMRPKAFCGIRRR